MARRSSMRPTGGVTQRADSRSQSGGMPQTAPRTNLSTTDTLSLCQNRRTKNLVAVRTTEHVKVVKEMLLRHRVPGIVHLLEFLAAVRTDGQVSVLSLNRDLQVLRHVLDGTQCRSARLVRVTKAVID